jgi:hypothetical protein
LNKEINIINRIVQDIYLLDIAMLMRNELKEVKINLRIYKVPVFTGTLLIRRE